MLAGLYFVL